MLASFGQFRPTSGQQLLNSVRLGKALIGLTVPEAPGVVHKYSDISEMFTDVQSFRYYSFPTRSCCHARLRARLCRSWLTIRPSLQTSKSLAPFAAVRSPPRSRRGRGLVSAGRPGRRRGAAGADAEAGGAPPGGGPEGRRRARAPGGRRECGKARGRARGTPGRSRFASSQAMWTTAVRAVGGRYPRLCVRLSLFVSLYPPLSLYPVYVVLRSARACCRVA